jgi:hypothetical protein
MAVSYQKHELLSLSKHLGSPRVFGEFRVAHLFSFLCYVLWFVCLHSVYCAQCYQCPCISHSWLHFRFSNVNLNTRTLDNELKNQRPNKNVDINFNVHDTFLE